MDKSDIGGGADFVEEIKRGLSSSGAVVVVIGEHWLNASWDGQRRLDQPGDYVRFEVASGLASGALVLPVLVDGAKMPGEQDLPDDIKALARRQAVVLDDLHWQEDLEKLVLTLDAELVRRGAGLWRALIRLWRRRLVRAAAAVVALAAAVAVQYRLAYRPLPVDLVETGLFSPAVLAPGRDQFVIEGPVTSSADGLLFSHVGRPYELVDVSCEGARLDDPTLAVLRQLDSNPPTAPAPFGLQTVAPKDEEGKEVQTPSGEPCRTSVELSAERNTAMPRAIHLYRLGGDGGERFRSLELKAAGADLLLSAVTAMADEGTPSSLGCRKRLTLGDGFQEVMNGTFTVGAVVADGGAVRLNFSDARGGPPHWGDAAGLFQPFVLGGEKQKPGDPAPLRARAVSVTAQGGPSGPDAPPSLSARAADGELLNIDGLKVGAEQIQVGVSGRGLVRVGGEDYVNLASRVRSNPVAAVLFAVADIALVVWFLLQLFGARRRA